MMPVTTQIQHWRQTLGTLTQPHVIALFFLGIAAGLPLLLIFSSLSLWLREAGIDRATVTYFSWAALGYSFKFVWAPLVDRLPIPWLTQRLGRRRAWLLLAQMMVMSAILFMAFIDPARDSLRLMALAAVFLGFSSATQDIVLDAYRIESAPAKLQGVLSSSYIAGYRVGMLIAGAGALFLADYWGSTHSHYLYTAWRNSYLLMAAMMFIGILTTLLIKEPAGQPQEPVLHDWRDYAAFLILFVTAVTTFIVTFVASDAGSHLLQQSLVQSLSLPVLSDFIAQACRFIVALSLTAALITVLIKLRLVSTRIVSLTYLAPLKDFFSRYSSGLAWLILILIGVYRISDIMLGVIANVFYQDMGFTKPEIATVVKTFGLFMTIFGGFVGGLLAIRYGVMRILFLGAFLSAITNLLFMALAYLGHHIPMLYLVISADNLSAGLASAAFIAFLSSLTNIAFTAMQYAIFSSLMTLLPKILGGYSGGMVDAMGYPQFFLMTTLFGIPVLILIAIIHRYLTLKPVPIP